MTTVTEVENAPVTQDRPQTQIPPELDDAVLRQAIESARDGVSISDAINPENPLVYVNPAFEKMTGYHADEILGTNCRFLQGNQTNQPEVAKIRRAIERGESCIVTLRNFTRSGKLFYNELSMAPVHDAKGCLTHYIGIQKDVTRRVMAEKRLIERDRELQKLNFELERLARCDGLTGLLNRRTFDDCLQREWRRALREKSALNLYMVDIDHFKKLNDQFGHAAGDACLRHISNVLEECFGRASDFVARYGGEEFVILNAGSPQDQALAQGEKLLQAVREQNSADLGQKITVSIGCCSAVPEKDTNPEKLLQTADAALYRAKNSGRDRMEITQLLKPAE